MRADWQDFYEAMAKAIGNHSGADLYGIIRTLASQQTWLAYMHFEDAALWQKRGHSLDPFSVMGIFNRGQSDQHRAAIGKALAETFTVKQAVPTCYHGIPYLDPRKSIYDGDEQMWELYRAAGKLDAQFIAAWNKAINVYGNGLGTLSIGLFWIMPNLYMAVDRISVPYIHEVTGVQAPHDKCDGEGYVKFLNELSARLKAKAINYPELAFAAWQETHDGAEC